MATHTNAAKTKGIIPRYILVMGTSLAIPDMMNTFKPIGGVINPVSTITTVIVPNHIGSNPRDRTTGYTTGTRISNMAKASIRQPRIRYRMRMPIIMPIGGTGRVVMKSAKAVVTPLKARK